MASTPEKESVKLNVLLINGRNSSQKGSGTRSERCNLIVNVVKKCCKKKKKNVIFFQEFDSPSNIFSTDGIGKYNIFGKAELEDRYNGIAVNQKLRCQELDISKIKNSFPGCSVHTRRCPAITISVKDKKIVLVSYHGPNNIPKPNKIEQLKSLIQLVKKVATEHKCHGWVIGGDFNCQAVNIDSSLEYNVYFHSPNSKDYFLGSMEVTKIKEISLIKDKDGKVIIDRKEFKRILDHFPVKGRIEINSEQTTSVDRKKKYKEHLVNKGVCLEEKPSPRRMKSQMNQHSSPKPDTGHVSPLSKLHNPKTLKGIDFPKEKQCYKNLFGTQKSNQVNESHLESPNTEKTESPEASGTQMIPHHAPANEHTNVNSDLRRNSTNRGIFHRIEGLMSGRSPLVDGQTNNSPGSPAEAGKTEQLPTVNRSESPLSPDLRNIKSGLVQTQNGEWKDLPVHDMSGKLAAFKRTWIPAVMERPSLAPFIPPSQGKDVKGDGIGKTSARLAMTAFKDQVPRKDVPTTDPVGAPGASVPQGQLDNNLTTGLRGSLLQVSTSSLGVGSSQDTTLSGTGSQPQHSAMDRDSSNFFIPDDEINSLSKLRQTPTAFESHFQGFLGSSTAPSGPAHLALEIFEAKLVTMSYLAEAERYPGTNHYKHVKQIYQNQQSASSWLKQTSTIDKLIEGGDTCRGITDHGKYPGPKLYVHVREQQRQICHRQTHRSTDPPKKRQNTLQPSEGKEPCGAQSQSLVQMVQYFEQESKSSEQDAEASSQRPSHLRKSEQKQSAWTPDRKRTTPERREMTHDSKRTPDTERRERTNDSKRRKGRRGRRGGRGKRGRRRGGEIRRIRLWSSERQIMPEQKSRSCETSATEMERRPKPTSSGLKRNLSVTDQTERDPKRRCLKYIENKQIYKSQKLSIKLTSQKLVLSDDVMRNVDEVILDPEGTTEVKAFPGATIEEMESIIADGPDLSYLNEIVIHVGTNNIALYDNGDNADYSLSLESLAGALKSRTPLSTIITFTSALPWTSRSDSVRNLNRSIRFMCRKAGFEFLDISDKFESQPGVANGKLFNDALHPNDKGDKKLIETLRNELDICIFPSSAIKVRTFIDAKKVIRQHIDKHEHLTMYHYYAYRIKEKGRIAECCAIILKEKGKIEEYCPNDGNGGKVILDKMKENMINNAVCIVSREIKGVKGDISYEPLDGIASCAMEALKDAF